MPGKLGFPKISPGADIVQAAGGSVRLCDGQNWVSSYWHHWGVGLYRMCSQFETVRGFSNIGGIIAYVTCAGQRVFKSSKIHSGLSPGLNDSGMSQIDRTGLVVNTNDA